LGHVEGLLLLPMRRLKWCCSATQTHNRNLTVNLAGRNK